MRQMQERIPRLRLRGRIGNAVPAGNIASSSGSAIAAPAPRKNVRRAMDFLLMNIVILSFGRN